MKKRTFLTGSGEYLVTIIVQLYLRLYCVAAMHDESGHLIGEKCAELGICTSLLQIKTCRNYYIRVRECLTNIYVRNMESAQTCNIAEETLAVHTVTSP